MVQRPLPTIALFRLSSRVLQAEQRLENSAATILFKHRLSWNCDTFAEIRMLALQQLELKVYIPLVTQKHNVTWFYNTCTSNKFKIGF
jgi:hypothetical protein